MRYFALDNLPLVAASLPWGPVPLTTLNRRGCARCPECEREDLYEIPLQVDSNVPGDLPATCGNCGAKFRVDPSSPANPDVGT